MSILDALRQQSSSIDDLAKLPQTLIMQMAQKGQIEEYMLAPILGRKAEMANAVARMQALKNSNQPQVSVMEQIIDQNAMAEQPQMEELGVAQIPIPEREYAGGGIVAFARGSLVEDDDDIDIYNDYAMASAAAKQANAMPVAKKSIFPKSYKATLAEKGQTPASVRQMMIDGPKKGDYVAPPLVPSMERRNRGNHKYESLVIAEAERIGLDPNIAIHALYKETGNLKNPETARSSAGAIGPMQLMPKTAKELGVDPFIPEDNVRGGVMYLKKQFDKYQDPTLALAAYNAGPGRVDRVLKSGQGIAGLPLETRNYVVANRMAEGGSVKHFDTGGLNKPFITDSKGITRKPQYPLALYKKPSTLLKKIGRGSGYGTAALLASEGIQALIDSDTGTASEDLDPIAAMQGTQGGYERPDRNKDVLDRYSESRKKELAEKIPKFDFPPQRGIGPSDAELRRDAQANAIVEPPETLTSDVDMSSAQTPVKSELAMLLEQNAADRQALTKQRSEDQNMALLAAGLGMLGGESPYAFSNIGKGGLAGVSFLSEANKQRAAQQAVLDKNRITAMHYGNVGKYYDSQIESKEEKLNRQKSVDASNLVQKALIGITQINDNMAKALKTFVELDKDFTTQIDPEKRAQLIARERARLDAQAKPLLTKYYAQAEMPMPDFSPTSDIFSKADAVIKPKNK